MEIYSLIIHDEVNNIHPVYEVHSWAKAEEIIKATQGLSSNPFTWEVVGKANPIAMESTTVTQSEQQWLDTAEESQRQAWLDTHTRSNNE